MQTNVAKQAVEMVIVVYKMIEASGWKGIPAGTLYVRLMEHGCTADTYQRIEDILINAGMVKKSNYVLTAAVR